MNQKLNIGFLTSRDPLNKGHWSGTHYFMFNALKKLGFNMVALGPVKISGYLDKFLDITDYLCVKLFKSRYNKETNLLLSFYWRYKFKKALSNRNIDIILAPVASTEIAFLETNIPVCYISDSSYGQISKYYRTFSSFTWFSGREAEIIEKRALFKSSKVVYPTSWAAEYVKGKYNVNSKKISIVKFGANISQIPTEYISKESFDPFNLLFVGTDWERKGGQIVYETFLILLNRGISISLTVCGCVPPVKHPQMQIFPFLDKNKETDEKIYKGLLFSSHLFFLPTRAECFGIVFCEAAAFSVPVITTKTGGVASVIEDGVNGFALPTDAPPIDYADLIQRLINDKSLYDNLCFSSRKKYENELNWDIWAEHMNVIFNNMIEEPRSKTEKS